MGDDRQLRHRQLPAGLGLRLLVEDLPVNLQRPQPEETLRPDVLILSSGDRTPFEAIIGVADPALPGELERGQARYRISAPPLGTLKVEGPLS